VLHIHRAERADALVDALRDLLADPLDDPFAAEVVAVPTRGMERWLTQRLSETLGAGDGRTDGVCANVAFPSPRRLADEAVGAACGLDPDADPWAPERAVWPLLDIVDESLHEPWLHPLAAHLGARETSAVRRFGTVRHLADLFDRYALHRPEMVRAWAAGDGASWQAELWRRLADRIAHPDPTNRRAGACARLREDPKLADLPRRIALFNLTRLPQGHLDVLRALAAHRDVHLFLLHPSPALWETVAAATPAGSPITIRAKDPTATMPANRLLASWGHDARELQLVVTGHDDPHTDHHHPVEHHASTLLERIQADIRADRPPAQQPLAAGDRSVEVHSCHGRARQVEILRDAILHLLEADETLEPRDVIVLCPDIETFAPLIHATFGVGDLTEEDDEDALAADVRPPDLRVRLADRSLRQTNPILGAVAELLDLAGRRVTASEILDFADRDPVRRRFRLDDDGVARLEDWVAESGIRWGLDAAHRAPFKLDGLESGTWRAGLDRLLVGVTMSEDGRRLCHGVLPLDDVESGAIDLAGRFAELVDRVQAALDALTRTQPIDAWARALAAAADTLTATAPRESWQRDQLQRLLDDVVAEAGGRATALSTPEIRALLAERLRGRPTRANFRTGHLTVCTLMPMRSVPHRVVCLLGMDDAQFPRKAPRDGDDLMLDEPHLGDRDPRTEDRQLLLDALMAATDRLVVTYTGNDERTNAPKPPAVPIGELLDVVQRSTGAAEQVLVRHPLQPFDPRNFHADEPWSFDRVTLDGARALQAPRTPEPKFLAEPLPPSVAPVADLDALVRFVAHPVRAFLRQRLGISLGEREDEIADALPVELDGLGRWGVGQRLLDAVLDGADLDSAAAAERARGTLPPGRLGVPVLAQVSPVVQEIAAAALRIGDEPRSLDVNLTLPGGRRLTGTVAGVCGDVLRTVTYSRVAAKHRLALWVQWLALTAAHPDRPWEGALVGKARRGTGDARITIASLAPLAEDAAVREEQAVAHLLALVDLHERGLREPLPLYCATSAAYARAASRGGDAVKAGRGEWESPWGYDREDRELEHQRVLGGVLTFEELLMERPRPDEAWEDTEDSRFGRYARRLWDGLLAHEEITDR
jgi:exodeoxyribonuclease V gamma subunit